MAQLLMCGISTYPAINGNLPFLDGHTLPSSCKSDHGSCLQKRSIREVRCARDDKHTGIGTEVVSNQTTSRKINEDKQESHAARRLHRQDPEGLEAGARPKQPVASSEDPGEERKILAYYSWRTSSVNRRRLVYAFDRLQYTLKATQSVILFS